ncbi:hypothetical protein RJ639_014856 [Escallonia herrerae]|uniref:Thaumatin-like protein n=1 Tax=Escallonia herrerae TaxID=1293975 RepID=A0AA89ANR5_9ASTE|nr:hypothetical protein RJ639_014856 [Escallonia herrerae]
MSKNVGPSFGHSARAKCLAKILLGQNVSPSFGHSTRAECSANFLLGQNVGPSFGHSARAECSANFLLEQNVGFNSHGKCTTGDCGGVLQCAGAGGTPPASLAEFTLGTTSPDFYDVSLVDGYNIPLSIVPHSIGSNCSVVRCLTDLNLKCPTALQVKMNGQVVACMSACMAFKKPEYCCCGAYNNPKFYDDPQQLNLLPAATGSCPGTTILVPLRSAELPPDSASSLAMRAFLLTFV